MLKVGLTGNIASGKSSVVRVWQELGGRVVDADQLARQAVAPGTSGLEAIITEWGSGVLNEDGTLNRGALRDIVFRDPAARARLEAIVHPEVGRLRDAEYRQAAERGEPLLVADIPLLFEVGMEGEFDVIVLVDAPAEVRQERLERDRGLEPGTARQMIEAQMPSEQKRPRVGVIIDNTGSKEQLEARAREVWQELQERATAGEGGTGSEIG